MPAICEMKDLLRYRPSVPATVPNGYKIGFQKEGCSYLRRSGDPLIPKDREMIERVSEDRIELVEQAEFPLSRIYSIDISEEALTGKKINPLEHLGQFLSALKNMGIVTNKAFLVGSFAMGLARKDSDLDVAASLDRLIKKESIYRLWDSMGSGIKLHFVQLFAPGIMKGTLSMIRSNDMTYQEIVGGRRNIIDEYEMKYPRHSS